MLLLLLWLWLFVVEDNIDNDEGTWIVDDSIGWNAVTNTIGLALSSVSTFDVPFHVIKIKDTRNNQGLPIVVVVVVVIVLQLPVLLHRQ